MDKERIGAGGIQINNDDNGSLTTNGDSLHRCIVPFIACGDLSGYYVPPGLQFLDANKSYPLDNDQQQSKEYISPIAPPLRPPYEMSIAKAKEARARKDISS